MGYVLSILFFHFVADFLLQTDNMARNKSHSVYWLSVHVLVYTLAMTTLALLFLDMSWLGLIAWAILNGILHWMTDYVTSFSSSWAWEKGRTRLFFNIIGLDQFIHVYFLLSTFEIFLLY